MSAVLVEDGIDKGAIWHFGQPNHEQRALFEGTAWADLSHRAVITVSGEDRLKWLHDLTTQYLLELAPNTWTTALILDPQGHVEHQLFLVDDGTTTWVHTEAERAPSLVQYLQKMVFMLRVEVKDRSAEFAVMRAPGKPDGMGGPYEIIARADLADLTSIWSENNMQIGTWALEAERISNGRPRIGADMDYKSIPNELGLLNTSVHMQKGCYRGQETVAKVFNLGQPPRRLTLLHLDGSMVDLPAHGAPVELDGKEVGFIGSVARHHELGPIALALIKRNVPIDATLVAAGIPASQELINK
jgi:folate-binding protein YgfZ